MEIVKHSRGKGGKGITVDALKWEMRMMIIIVKNE